MPTRTRRQAAPAKKGLSPKLFKGVNQKKLEQKSGSGLRVSFNKENPTATLQFLTPPSEWAETERHVFQEDGRWNFVPCAGDACPLCDSDDQEAARPSYLALAPVYSHTSKRVQILELNKTMAGLVFHKFQRLVEAKKERMFTKRVYDVTVFPTKPRTYDVELAEDAAAVNAASLADKMPDFEEFLINEMKRYYGDDLPDTSGVLETDDEEDLDEDLDDEELEDEEDFEDEEEDDDDLEDEEDEDEDLDDEDDEDEDEEDDEDDDLDDDEDIDEDEPLDPNPVKAAKKIAARAPRKTAGTKAPAAKAPARKAPAKAVAAKKTASRARR